MKQNSSWWLKSVEKRGSSIYIIREITENIFSYFPTLEISEQEKNGLIKANGRQAWLDSWWYLWRRREEMLNAIRPINRYISCAQVTKRPIFEFISSEINPNAALMVFAFEDDYSFGIISSFVHWIWFREKCSTLEERLRYTTESVWDTFPWPQMPTNRQIEQIAEAARNLRIVRNDYLIKNGFSLRDLYRTLEKPGKNVIRELHHQLDIAVIDAYGFDPDSDLLQQLLDLNLAIFSKELNGEEIQCPGIPKRYKNKSMLISDDCVSFNPKLK